MGIRHGEVVEVYRLKDGRCKARVRLWVFQGNQADETIGDLPEIFEREDDARRYGEQAVAAHEAGRDLPVQGITPIA